MKAFLDTSAMIDILSQEPSALAAVDKIREDCELCTSTVNIYEIMRGIIGGDGERRELAAVEELAASLEVLPFDSGAARDAARAYSSLRSKGKPVSEADYLIAGICASHGIRIIVTQNRKHFQNFSFFDKIISYSLGSPKA